MTENQMLVHEPRAPHADTMARAECIISADAPSGAALVVYCRTNRCGGVYFVDQRVWALYVPMPLDEFLRTLEARNIAIDASARSTWLLAVGGAGSEAIN